MLIASYDSYLSYINYPTPFAERRLALDIRGPGLGCSCWNVSKKGSNGLDMAIGGMNSRITSIQIIQRLDFEHSTCSNGSSNCNYVLRRTFMYGIMDIGNLI